jgi:hypothetical protein
MQSDKIGGQCSLPISSTIDPSYPFRYCNGIPRSSVPPLLPFPQQVFADNSSRVISVVGLRQWRLKLAGRRPRVSRNGRCHGCSVLPLLCDVDDGTITLRTILAVEGQ